MPLPFLSFHPRFLSSVYLFPFSLHLSSSTVFRLSLSAPLSFFFRSRHCLSAPHSAKFSSSVALHLIFCPSCTSGFHHGCRCSCFPSICPTGQPPPLFFPLFLFLSELSLSVNLSGFLSVTLSKCVFSDYFSTFLSSLS